jgi:hypothetical protein
MYTDANKDLWTRDHTVEENNQKKELDILENILPNTLGMEHLIIKLFLVKFSYTNAKSSSS